MQYFLLQYTFESLFRSQQYALVDNACREYLFITEFFIVSGNNALDLFNAIMGKTLNMFLVSWSCLTYPCKISFHIMYKEEIINYILFSQIKSTFFNPIF